jgi:tetratricopeptide (TPR) repeat protein
MDARRSVCLAATFFFCCLGCVHTDPNPSSSNDQVVTKAAKPIDLPKRKPLPETCIAMGDLRAKTAENPKCNEVERQRLRDEARRAYQEALEIDPKCMAAFTALARLYIVMEDYDRAEATYQRAIQAYPKDAALEYDLGMCYARQKKFDKALAALAKACELDPEKKLYSHTCGYCLVRAGRYDDGYAVLSKVEGKAQAHYDVARMLDHIKQTELAKQHLLEALSADPQHAPSKSLLSAIEQRKVAEAPTTIHVPSRPELPTIDATAFGQ